MHFVLVKLSRNSLLLNDDPSKRGDVKTLARSSISPLPQVKMKFKLLPLDRGHLKPIFYGRGLSFK